MKKTSFCNIEKFGEKFICKNCWVTAEENQIRECDKKEVGAIEKALSFFGSCFNHFFKGETTNKEVLTQRLNKCNICPARSSEWNCNACGCNLTIKASWLEQDCPLCTECGRKRDECSCEEFISKWRDGKLELNQIDLFPEASPIKKSCCGN